MAYIYNESFTTGAAPSNWTGTANYGYTTSPAPLEGSFSVHVEADETATYSHSADVTVEQWGRFLFHPLALPTSFELFFATQDSAFTVTPINIYLNSSGTLTLDGSGAFETTVGTMSANTSYYVFWRYKPSTGGNNGQLELWFNTTDSRSSTPANNHVVYNSGTNTAGIQYQIYRCPTAGGGGPQPYIMDKAAWANTDEFGGGSAKPWVYRSHTHTLGSGLGTAK